MSNPPVPLDLRPMRLQPGNDLRHALEAECRREAALSAFVVSGIGSLVQASLRLADQVEETVVAGPLEILTLSGSLSPDGAHLHMSVADGQGRVLGGHVAYGNLIRTTAEVLIAALAGWELQRVLDEQTGYRELRVHRRSGA